MGGPVSVPDFERLAAERVPPEALAYIWGGAEDEETMRENVAAFERVRLRPRVLAGIEQVTAETSLLGAVISMPVVVAPTAYQTIAHPDGEIGMARAAAAAGSAICLSTMATAGLDEVARAAADAPRYYQVYVFRDRGLTEDLIAEALELDYSALFLTVDLALVGKRDREVRISWEIPHDRVPALRAADARGLDPRTLDFDPALDWAYLERLCASVPVPVVVKVVQTEEDAKLAVEHGAAGIVVSNHGGRQLDGVSATIDLLPDVAAAVESRAEVLLDGGIRRGSDVVKALALGARAVLVGRAPLWGLAVAGEEGARAVLEILREETEIALHLLGCRTPGEVGPRHVSRIGPS